MDLRFVARLATAQHGVVARGQLLDLGLSATQIRDRCRSGAWTIVWRGVYAIGHAPLTRRGWLMAAVLACGEGAVLSHLSAAELWQLTTMHRPGYHVTVTKPGGRRLSDITVHRRSEVDATTLHSIPVTTIAGTILDAAVLVGRRGTEKMLDQADRLRLCTYADLEVAAEKRSGHRGTGIVRELLVSHLAGSTVTRSHLEELFLALCRREGLPQPLVNVELLGLTVDFYWPEHRVAVETDGSSTHRTRERFEQDLRRSNRLALGGILLLRFSYDDVTRHARATAVRLRRALRTRATN